MKQYLWILSFLLFVGCNNERVVDIASPPEMEDKDVIIIFNSLPEELCYSDRLSEIFNDSSLDYNFVEPQLLSLSYPVDCISYGFYECDDINYDMGYITCYKPDSQKSCMSFFEDEYTDIDGESFNESCILGVNYID
jgi:hypothetical protein